MQSEESDELSPPPWLTTEPEKGGCFEALGLPRRLLSRRVYRGAVKKQKRYSALKLPIAVDSQTAMFAYIDPGNETASGLRFWGKGNQSEAKPCHRKSTAISVDPWEASRYLSFSLHRHHRQRGEYAIGGIELHGHSGEDSTLCGAAHRPHEIGRVGAGEHLLDELGLLPVGRQRDLHLFKHNAPFHQSAPDHHRFISQVTDGRRGADTLRLAASREDGVTYELAGPHPGDPDVRGDQSAGPRKVPPRQPIDSIRFTLGR